MVVLDDHLYGWQLFARVTKSIFCSSICLLSTLVSAITPGGLVSSQNFGTGTSSSMEVTIQIEVAPPNSSSYFWAQQFWPNSTLDHGGYFGIQMGGNINGIKLGKMFVFSIWNAVAAEAATGAVAQKFDGEGIGYSIRKAVTWKEGTPYTFRLEKDGAMWWRLSVAGELMGRIQITQDVQLQNGFLAFTEYFADVPSCNSVPYAKAIFSPITFNGVSLLATDSTPYGNCISIAKGSLKSGSAVHEVGLSPPICTLTASSALIINGDSSTLTASCNPSATSYTWAGGNCVGVTGASCFVRPTTTTTYMVSGINANGTGAAANATVAVSNANSLNLTSGWNLSGNSVNTPLTVATAFGNVANVTSVWKWNSTATKWVFYSPEQSDGGAAYATSNGYEPLTTINAGEGFWVNAKQAFTTQLPFGTTIAASSFKNLPAGWSLVATGDNPTAKGFNIEVSSTPPSPGAVPNNVVNLWAWDSTSNKWYFYDPSLDATGGTALKDYINTNGYLDFAATNKTLGPGTGFWVRR